MPNDNTLLKLAAMEREDLAIVSAHLQDAVAKVGEMAYLPAEKRFAMVVNRFDWIAASEQAKSVRRRAGLHFERVLSARTRNLDLKDEKAVVNLLAVEFAEKDAPSGTITLYFSGDAAIQLEVECIEMAMRDLGPEWAAKKRPQHD
ncbi:MAG: DUF2948 family protein [Xanthobacteraceae bacterium]|nr:DUF2948 family protein [Xanthobacteraceae bacterium]MBX3522537.1 DUF2948 family protein [Xanthobacteraceae bacterium]MBX3535589.1 DUF2948 family protein [Xanthobacteraceae bacterium]MCW5673670.1 DUF2948 family protein [Xanthobacteraceae bacterium]MCW5678472.1 DUF2948 family protein [Xanthobacteraceae bacterium]